jgi:hypothetical protein
VNDFDAVIILKLPFYAVKIFIIGLSLHFDIPVFQVIVLVLVDGLPLVANKI